MEQPLLPDVDLALERLKSPDPGERILAAAGLAKLDCHDERVRLALEAAAGNDPDVFVRAEAFHALQQLGFTVSEPADWEEVESSFGQSDSSQAVSTKRPSRLTIFVLVSCSLVLLSCAGVVCITFGFLTYLSGNPKDIVVSYDIPARVPMDETFDLTLQITNTGSSDMYIGDIDLQNMFSSTILEGLVVLGTEPEMERDYSIQGVKTFRFNRTLAPGETQKAVFHLQPIKPGNFGGPVAVYVGMLPYEVYPTITVTK